MEVMQGQESLLSQCMKDWYFPRNHFLEASYSPNSSYTWNSIMAAKPILQRGSCWRIGNGRYIRVLNDAWIPNHPTNRVLHPAPNIEEDMKVSELIDQDSRGWDREFIWRNFHSDDAEAILRVPLSYRVISDTVVWIGEKSGEYSMRSGYREMRKACKEMDWIESTRGVVGGGVWKMLWKLKAIDVKTEPETEIHALWNCGVAQDIWACCSARLQKCQVGQDDMLQLWEELIARLTIDELELFLVQAWIMWNQRNAMVRGKHWQALRILNRRAEDYLEEFKSAQSRLVTRPPNLNPICWRPPPLNRFKLNFDAAIFEGEEASGFSAIIRNERGEVMAAFSGNGPLVSCSEEA
ncbi:uncharacterized protein LOC142640297 [Castanea sativa]|uniref:uncharacterized protein LOC142640297 n=1 Tax=Castanea sativa TaxID=21020 RepID=UPI003F653475